MAKTSKIKQADFEVNEATLLPVNPLMQSVIITPGEETEQKVAMINEIESLAEINKQQLAVRREKVSLENDNKKLDISKVNLRALEKAVDILASDDVLVGIKNNIKTALDYKLLSEGIYNIAKTQDLLNKTNVLDEFGNKKRTKINFMFKSNGPVQAAVQIDNSDD
jgi:hypothetical protein